MVSRKIEKLVAPFYSCPKYIKCSVNSCPLDPLYPNRVTSDLDREKICTLPKDVRIIISKDHPGLLRFNGLTKEEFETSLSGHRTPMKKT